MNLKGRDFLKEIDFSKDEFLQIIETAEKLKKKKKITKSDYAKIVLIKSLIKEILNS